MLLSLLVCGVPRPNAPTGLGAPAGVVGPHHIVKELVKHKQNHTTTHSTQAADAVSATANSTVADFHGEPTPALSMAEQHTQMEEACLGSGTVSKLQNRLRVEQSEFQLLRGEVDRLSSENYELAAVPTLARPPRVGPSTILQHGVWYHRRWGLRAMNDKEAAGSKPAAGGGLVLLADDLDRGEEPFGTADWWEYAGVVLVLLLISSFAACLVALLSISMLDLGVLELQGSDAEKAQVAQLRPLIEQPRRLLVTLLLVYVGASEALPVFLDKLMPDWLAIVVSAAAILTLGEVLPQAFCTSPNKLAIAAFFSPVVRVLMFVLFPLAWPLAWALDKILGPRRQKASELQATMQLDTDSSTRPRDASKANANATPPPEPREKSAGDAMTTWEDAFTLSSSTYLDDEVLALLAPAPAPTPAPAPAPALLAPLAPAPAPTPIPTLTLTPTLTRCWLTCWSAAAPACRCGHPAAPTLAVACCSSSGCCCSGRSRARSSTPSSPGSSFTRR